MTWPASAERRSRSGTTTRSGAYLAHKSTSASTCAEYQREYLQRPEVKERRREYQREYQQRPEIKERQREYQREYYQRRKRAGHD